MKLRIKYDVNVLRMKNKKSMMKNFFFTKKPCSIMNQRLPHSSFNKFSLVCVNKILPKIKQISAWKKLSSSALDSAKATIVSQALYNSECSYGAIPEALIFSRLSTFSCAC